MNREDFNGKVFVPSNIKNKKRVVIGKFDIRDLVYILIIACISVPIYFVFKEDSVQNALIIAGIPAFILGFAAFKKWDNMKFEEYIFFIYSNKFKSKPQRINSSDNIYEILERKASNKNITVNNNKNTKSNVFNINKMLTSLIPKKNEENNKIISNKVLTKEEKKVYEIQLKKRKEIEKVKELREKRVYKVFI